MLSLPSVTLMIVDCISAERAVEVIKKCTSGVTFGSIKLLTSKETDSPHAVKIPPIKNLTEYSEFMLRHSWEYCNTDYMQIVQHDGWILNPEAWEDDWPRYDYIGPLFIGETKINNNSVGSGGFSFRSRKLMKWVSENLGVFVPGWGWWGYVHEDGVITKGMKDAIAKAGFAFAPPDRAAKYAYGGNMAMFCPKPFGFHGFYALRKLDKEYDNLFLPEHLIPEGANT